MAGLGGSSSMCLVALGACSVSAVPPVRHGE